MTRTVKRTLSLVLALIMICSTMGVMAFAAEGPTNAEIYVRFYNTSNALVATARIYADGYYCEEDGTAEIWDLNWSFSGSQASNLSVGSSSVGGDRANMELRWRTTTVEMIVFTLSDDGTWTVDGNNIALSVAGLSRITVALV